MAHVEYTELTIPLDIRITPRQTRSHEGQWHATAAVEADPIIEQYLERAARAGWVADGSCRLVALAMEDRVRFHVSYGVIIPEWKHTDYISVTIRLRRVAP